MRAFAHAPLVALSFLSVTPLHLPADLPRAAFGRAVAFFPLVGALLGGIVAAANLPAAPSLALVVLLSGVLHLDGLADTADGLFASRTREERLALMRESTVGAFGVTAIVLALLVEFAALDRLATLAPLVVACVGSRAAMSAAVVAFPYARAHGAGAAFARESTWADLAVALAFAAGIAWFVGGLAGVALIALGLAVVPIVGWRATGLLGGLTGDVYGAIGELSFAAILLAAAAVP